MGCKETLPVSRASGEGNPGDEHTQGVLSCFISPPSLAVTWRLLPLPWLQGWGWRGSASPGSRWEGRERKRFEVAGDHWHSRLRRQRAETP